MTYAFRIRFRIPAGQYIAHDGPELVLRDGAERRVSIRPLTEDLAVKQEHEFALRGVGYATIEDATEDGERWIGALTLGFMAEFLPADFGMRAPRGFFFQGALDVMSAERGAAVYNDDPGLLVVPEEPTPMFGRVGVDVAVGKNAEGTVTAVRDVYEARLRPDEQTLLAFEMFSAAENMPPGDADSRFLMLMIAVEALIDAGSRPDSQVTVLDRLREHLESMDDLIADDARSLGEALRQLKQESIGSSGRRLAASLGDRTYDDLAPIDFFRKCYKARSNLIHGNVGTRRPDIELIRSLIGPLLRFVRDLIRLRAGADWPHPRDSHEHDEDPNYKA